ncbi:MAG: HTH domain-containing protein [Parcubacteria group bacterium]|nr:HTH domain-containing protein [Parcubacteria group bacterium]
MEITYLYIVLFLLLAVILLVWLISGARHVVRGVCVIKDIRDTKKEERKKKILSLLKGKNKVTNKVLREKLNVSSKTVVNYCDELEKEGKIKQVGKVGRSTSYKLK